jgi:tRNA (Thr-GGU) A37 N-methylase
MYLLWYDDSAKKAPKVKIEEAIGAYTDRFKTRPNVVLVNEADRAEIMGVLVRCEGYIRQNNFWVGWEDATKM